MDHILHDILQRTPKHVFNACIKVFNIHGIYSANRNYLLHKYFNGDQLKYSIAMAKLFNQFSTQEQELQSKELQYRMTVLKTQINRKKRFMQPHSEQVTEYNEIADRLAILNEGANKLISLYKKLNTTKKAPL